MKFVLPDSEKATLTSYSFYIEMLQRLYDFPKGGENLVVSGKNHPKTENFEKHLLRGHFLASDRVFWAIVRENRFTGLGCTRRVKRQKKIKVTSPVVATA